MRTQPPLGMYSCGIMPLTDVSYIAGPAAAAAAPAAHHAATDAAPPHATPSDDGHEAAR